MSFISKLEARLDSRGSLELPFANSLRLRPVNGARGWDHSHRLLAWKGIKFMWKKKP